MKLTCYHSCLWAALILRLLSSPTLVDTKNVVWPEGKTAALVESGHSQELSTVTLEALEGLFTENVLGKRELVVGYGEEVCGTATDNNILETFDLQGCSVGTSIVQQTNAPSHENIVQMRTLDCLITLSYTTVHFRVRQRLL